MAALPMPKGARWAVRGVDFDRMTEIALVIRNKSRGGAKIYGMSPAVYKDDFRVHGRVQHMVLQAFWRKLGAA
jgi:hypothetical protein